MYTVIQDRVAIKDDYNGTKTIGFLSLGEIIYPIRIIDNWIMFIDQKKYVWVKTHDNNNYYILDIDKSNIKDKEFDGFIIEDINSYINSIL